MTNEFVSNGMTDLEIEVLNDQFGRKLEEYMEFVRIRIDSGPGGVGGFFMKIKEERYARAAKRVDFDGPRVVLDPNVLDAF